MKLLPFIIVPVLLMTTFTYQTKNITVEQVHQIYHQLAHIYDKKREIPDIDKEKILEMLVSRIY